MSPIYDEPLERATELFRLVVPLILKQEATPNPISFAVWYEHVAGRNAALSREIEAFTANGGRLNEAMTQDLHQRYLVDADLGIAAQVHESLSRVMGDTAKTIVESQTTASGFAAELRQRQAVLHGPVDRLRVQQVLTGILADTEQVSTLMSAIGDKLDVNRNEVERLRDELRQARELALIDALSRLTNRRGFDLALEDLVARSTVSSEPLALIMLDIDHFKQFNDEYGHLLGDRVIRGVARAMESASRPDDVVSRYGGEEFAILLPATGMRDAAKVAERIRLVVSRAAVRRVDNDVPVGGVTVSAGVTEYRPQEPTADFVNRADKALYAAKFAGRNRVHER
jgi:diguanylate cyclase